MSLLPASDLLGRIHEIEEGLGKARRLKGWGWLALLAGTAQLVFMAVNSDAWKLITDPDARGELLGNWPFLLSVAAFVFVVLFVIRVRALIRESKEPFRYVCSIEDFDVVPPPPGDPSFDVAARLRFDLAERLSGRITRLSFLDLSEESADQGIGPAHIHIAGELLTRHNADGSWTVEATPRVRIGTKGTPFQFAHSVKFVLNALGRKRGLPVPRVSRFESGGDDEPSKDPPHLEAEEYEKVVERVYFSVASEIYRQIRRDVEHKIDMLPTRWLKGVAYLHEAEDYLRSNTLDAYDEAQQLFGLAVSCFDRRVPSGPDRGRVRTWLSISRLLSRLKRARRHLTSKVVPSWGRREVMIARAQIGYANTLVYRRVLAGLSGHRVNPIFEARLVAGQALRGLEKTSRRSPGQRENLFAGLVTAGLAAHYLDSAISTKEFLDKARSLAPFRAQEDPQFLFAWGLMERRPRLATPYLRRAVEENPRFEVAHFELALKTEYMWRMSPELEPSVAEEIVANEYREVLKINPGNIRAWTNLGYVYWLLGREYSGQARSAFLRGREYKEIRKTTYVAELDHGLALVDAEEGDVEGAFTYYSNAVSARIAQGMDHDTNTSAQFYFFDFIGDAMVQRVEEFQRRVSEVVEAEGEDISGRLRRSVLAFALNDCGEAYIDYYSRSGFPDYRNRARELFQRSIDENPEFVIPYFNLYLFEAYSIIRASNHHYIERHKKGALEFLERVNHLEPRWADAILARISAEARAAEAVEELVLSEAASGSAEKIPSDATGNDTGQPRGVRLKAKIRGAAPFGLDDGLERRDAKVKEGTSKSSAGTAIEQELRELVPHEWLWKNRGFNWKALGRPFVTTGRWEREMDDSHVRALLAWAAASFVDQRLRAEKPVDVVLMNRRLRKLLLHIQNRFWPANFWLLRHSRVLAGASRTAHRLRNVVEGWLKQDIGAFWALDVVLNETWEEPETAKRVDLFRVEDKLRLLNDAVAEYNLPSPLYCWLGKELSRLDEPHGAYEAYKKALASRDYRVLREAARALEIEEHYRDALFGYRRALACSDQAEVRDVIELVSRTVNLFAMTSRDRSRDEALPLRRVRTSPWRRKLVSALLEDELSRDDNDMLKHWLRAEGQNVGAREQEDVRQALDLLDGPLEVVHEHDRAGHPETKRA